LAPAIVQALCDAGFDVVLLARSAFMPFADVRTLLLPGDWTPAALQTLLADESIDAIVNLAGAGVRPGGIAKGALYEGNVALPPRLMTAASPALRAFVNLGSGSEYAGSSAPVALDEAAPLNPDHGYGLSKAAGGLAGKQVADELGIRFAHLRLFGAYGENEAPHRLLPTLVTRLSRGEVAPMSDGTQIRDWLYEADIGDAVVAALTALLTERMPGGIYNLGSGNGASVRRFAETVADLLGAPRPLLDFGAIPRRGKEVECLVADAGRFREYTAWKPAHPLDAGLALAIERIQQQRSLVEARSANLEKAK
jgi:nucleoside-diphosphate-sugar epimerase